MRTREHLNKAALVKDDEFYTDERDVQEEVMKYKDQFNGKVVYCNCDESDSAFTKFFIDNYHGLGLHGLYATSYVNKQASLLEDIDSRPARLLSYFGDKIEMSDLKEDGDFRSAECMDILRKSDIVVTNPPFSLFYIYYRLIMDSKKKFLLICNYLCIFKYVFNDYVAGNVKMGYNYIQHDFRPFRRPDGSKETVNVAWLTNLDKPYTVKPMALTAKYSADKYPKFDDLDAISVDMSCDIPVDYDGVIGVPVSYFRFHNPSLFNIVGKHNSPKLGGVSKFGRILIKRINLENQLNSELEVAYVHIPQRNPKMFKGIGELIIQVDRSKGEKIISKAKIPGESIFIHKAKLHAEKLRDVSGLFDEFEENGLTSYEIQRTAEGLIQTRKYPAPFLEGGEYLWYDVNLDVNGEKHRFIYASRHSGNMDNDIDNCWERYQWIEYLAQFIFSFSD